MTERIRAEGDMWSVVLDRSEEAPGVNALVFMCTSNPQRPYRVARIDEAEATHDPAELGGRRLHELFDKAQIMDYVSNRDAFPERAYGGGTSE